MDAFRSLFYTLDATTSSNKKIAALTEFFANQPNLDIAWSVFFLTGRRLKQHVSSHQMRLMFNDYLELPPWLLQECHSVVGDTAETVALLASSKYLSNKVSTSTTGSLCDVIETLIKPFAEKDKEEKYQGLCEIWSRYSSADIFLLNKFLTGGLRVGVSKKTVTKALALAFGQQESRIAHRLMGSWPVTAEFIDEMRHADRRNITDPAHPYPFCLANPLASINTLPKLDDWLAEWKWDGIRAQLIKRADQVFLWTRGEDIVNHQFPEIVESASCLPNGTVLDGELLVWSDNHPLAFHELQTRLGRKKPGPKLIKEKPCRLIAYDILELGGFDIRGKEMRQRRQLLEETIAKYPQIEISKVIPFETRSDLEVNWQNSRKNLAEGIMLKRKDAPYVTGRKQGCWWKWKVEPLTLDTVILYAEAGRGKRSNLCTSYTLGVWDSGSLVPIAKAYSGLSNDEITRLDRWIKKNTEEKFGPVRRLPPFQVLEIGFEGIAPSKRHKSGLALRFPRILRWREDKLAKEADTVTTAREILTKLSDNNEFKNS